MLDGLKTVGGRMAILRAMGNLSQKDFAKLSNINLSTIENIESGRTLIKREQAIKMVMSLKNIGIPASVDWIIDGIPLVASPVNFTTTHVLDNVYSIINSTAQLIINETNDFIKVGSIVLASSVDITQISDAIFMIIKHKTNVFACKVNKDNDKLLLYKKNNSEPLEFNEKMSIYFPDVIIMKH